MTKDIPLQNCRLDAALLKPYIGIIGSGGASAESDEFAYNVGMQVARNGAVLICGGLGGVMTAAARGAKDAGGTTIGVVPGSDRKDANPYIDFPIATGFGEARNLIIIRSSDAIIALPGEYGTLSEFAFALKLDKPVIATREWDLRGVTPVRTNPEEAVQLALQMMPSRTI